MLNKYRFLLISILLVLQTNLIAGSAPEQAFRVRQLYESLQFEQAVALGRSLLKSDHVFNREELLTIHQYSGYAFFNLGQIDSARAHFLSLLTIDSGYRLDPVNTSPKIIRFYNKIKKAYLQKRVKESNPAYVKYVFVEDPRPAAGWRSAILPGWGQYYKKQLQRGRIYGVAFVTAGVAALTGFALEKYYHQKYLDSKIPAKINDNYDKYNFWYKTRRVSLYLTAIVWGASIADALWGPYEKAKLSASFQNGTTLSLQINF